MDQWDTASAIQSAAAGGPCVGCWEKRTQRFRPAPPSGENRKHAAVNTGTQKYIRDNRRHHTVNTDQPYTVQYWV